MTKTKFAVQMLINLTYFAIGYGFAWGIGCGDWAIPIGCAYALVLAPEL